MMNEETKYVLSHTLEKAKELAYKVESQLEDDSNITDQDWNETYEPGFNELHLTLIELERMLHFA